MLMDNDDQKDGVDQSADAAPVPVEPAETSQDAQAAKHRSFKKPAIIILAVAVAVALIGLGWWLGHGSNQTADQTEKENTSTAKPTASSNSSSQTLQLDTGKNYGDKYADGVLPVGDGKYTTSGPKQGYVYVCSQYAQNLQTERGGAQSRGPWFSSDGKTYDINKKSHVEGSVHWTGEFTNTVNGSTRTITSNDLPLNHNTGIFPIQTTDPAYAYDRNPSTITAQSFTYSLPVSPTYQSKPDCAGGQVGIMLTGVALFSGFDAAGRDAGAWEVQDGCSGHPQGGGIYHYHTLSRCIKNISVHTVIGFALDGFPITGPQVGTKNFLTTNDLDECHGITSQIVLDGKTVTMYHYVMTQDFPYSVSCYRGTATQPPGQPQGQNAPSGPQRMQP